MSMDKTESVFITRSRKIMEWEFRSGLNNLLEVLGSSEMKSDYWLVVLDWFLRIILTSTWSRTMISRTQQPFAEFYLQGSPFQLQ